MVKLYKIGIGLFLASLILLGVLIVFSFVPMVGNYKIFTVQSGSMEPAIKTGSLIFVSPRSDYEIGDIVTKKLISNPKLTVTHRIIEERTENEKKYFRTQGDANNISDNDLVPEDMIIGKVFLAVPYLGYPVSYAKTTRGIMLIIVIPATIIIYIELNKIRDEIKKKLLERKEKKDEPAE